MTAVENSTESSIVQLAALQELDRKLREKVELRQLLEQEIADLDAQLRRQREVATNASLERDTTEARRRDLEARLEDEEEKLKDRRMRLNRVRNEKELQALRHGIELGKEASQLLEEELLRAMESAEGASGTAVAAVKLLGELEASVTLQIDERRQRIEQLTREIDEARVAREGAAHGLDVSLLRKYEQIFARRGGTAVVEVRNGTCLGCHMNLPPQFFNELQRLRDVRLCPNCHRILFWRPERLEPAEPPR
jgi:predicted  nucleic acid-binding Zn-ribbon protein